MVDPPEHNLRSVGLCHVDRAGASQILALAFRDDCFHRYVLHTWGKIGHGAFNDLQVNMAFFNELLENLQSEGAFCATVPGSPSVVVCNKIVVNTNLSITTGSCSRIPTALQEMESNSHAVLARTFESGSVVLHVYLVGRDHCSGKSSERPDVRARDVLKRVIKLATSQQWGLYLEATSMHSRLIFESLGFRVVQEIRVGCGLVDEHGDPSQSGRGVALWIAVILPEAC